ncbi:MAG TPA: rhomboid family intramembrane serine protease, partial [Actinobacteria bacterium]|nr:rhomboid family intramembrane serine protease [Actinomycetota bacterium]
SIGASSSSSGVAWFAHIGGFAAGVALVLFFSKRRKEDRLKYF